VGVAVETISRLERGSVVPSLVRMEEIAGVLGVDLPALFIFKDREFKDREPPRDKAVERLLAVVRRRPASVVVLGGGARGFARWWCQRFMSSVVVLGGGARGF
jgi:transcriptional regulator with XRE-family HTH domain